MDKNKKVALDILEAIGGAENIEKVWHCATRLRFNVHNMKCVDKEQIKNIEGVLGLVEAGEQLQIIIGAHVSKVYDQLCKESGAERQDVIAENLDEPKAKLTLKKVGENILDYMSGSVTPMIPGMVTASMFKMISVVFGPEMLGIIGESSNLYVLCTFLYDAFFYFLPVYLGYTAAKKLGVNIILGMFVGCMLLAPGFVELIGAEVDFTVYGIPCPVNDYSQTIVPVVLSVWVMSYVEKFFKKIIPDSLAAVFVPFMTIAVMVPATFCALAPLGYVLGEWIGNTMVAFGEHGGFVAVAVVAALWDFLVMSGMHMVLGIFSITMLMSLGVESFICPAASVATVAVFGMAFGAWLRLKEKKEKVLCLEYFITAIIGGVSEPTLYGIGFRYKRPFIALLIGGFLGGLYAGIMNVEVYAKLPSNFMLIFGYVGGSTVNMINGCISLVIAFVVTAVLTYLIGFKNTENQR